MTILSFFIENQPALQRPSQQFLRKTPQIFLKSTFEPPLIISLFLKKIAATRRRRARVEAAAPWLEFAHGEHAPQGLELSFDCDEHRPGPSCRGWNSLQWMGYDRRHTHHACAPASLQLDQRPRSQSWAGEGDEELLLC